MYHLLCPNKIVNSLYDIKAHSLQCLGIRGIIFDLDNTIIPWDQQEMSPEIIQWLQTLLNQGFHLCLVSNNMGTRVQGIAAILGIPCISKAYKPTNAGFLKAMGKMELSTKEVAVVGDQLFTDILGGNRLGLYTIWVKPLSTQEFIGTKITRRVEKLTVRLLRHKGLLK